MKKYEWSKVKKLALSLFFRSPEKIIDLLQININLFRLNLCYKDYFYSDEVLVGTSNFAAFLDVFRNESESKQCLWVLRGLWLFWCTLYLIINYQIFFLFLSQPFSIRQLHDLQALFLWHIVQLNILLFFQNLVLD